MAISTDPFPSLLVKRKVVRTVVDDIWSQLRMLILRGSLAPGARLVELEIASQTGVSQASVREALQRLERDGLVVRNGRSGTFVTEVSPENMHEIFLIRSMVEGFAIRRTARSITPQQIGELKGLIEEMRSAGQAGDTVRMVEHDMTFHQRICTWAENPTLLNVWTLLYAQLERFLVMYDALHFTDLTRVADSHLPTLQALEAGDPDLAAERVQTHIQYIMQGTSQATLT